MALEQHITKDDHWFVGEDKQFVYTIYQSDGATPQDVSGWGLEWVLRLSDFSSGDATLTKTTDDDISITGTFDSDPDVNTQKVLVAIADTDTESLTPTTYRYSLKRTDDGSETILAFGKAVLRQTTAR